MSDDDDDLFGGSSGDDTDDLIAESKSAPPVATKKKRLQKKSSSPTKTTTNSIPDADQDDDSDDDDGGGLFDDSDDEEAPKKPKALSKRQRMEALRAKKRSETRSSKAAAGGTLDTTTATNHDAGYDSGGSYSSNEYVRTKEDNDFIDVEGDDDDAIKELYAEQHFDDQRGEAEEDGKKKKKGRKRRGGDYSDDDDEEKGEDEPDNPIMAAVHRMKKKKRVGKKLSELEEEAKQFMQKMELAAEEDELAVRERRPATKKLTMLPEVSDMLARRDMMRLLLDFDVLSLCRRWIQPLPGGSLGNVTVRQRMIESISCMTGEQGITAMDLKRSDLGKVIMSLYMHPSETPALKKKHRKLIEQWSRPIFSKSGNMKDLEHAQASRARDTGMSSPAAKAAPVMQHGKNEHDLKNIIATGSSGSAKDGLNRVRVPFSKGFQFTVRPQNKIGHGVADKHMARGGGTDKNDTRGNLSRRMLEKGRAATKNQRSANISVEGRPTK